MSLIQVNTLPSLSGVATNSRFTLQAPVGRRSYQMVGFDIGGTLTKANVENIEVLVAGLPVQQWKSLTELEKVSSYYGYNVDPTAEFTIPFYKRFLTSSSEAAIFNYGTSDVPTLQIRGDLGTQASLTGLTAFPFSKITFSGISGFFSFLSCLSIFNCNWVAKLPTSNSLRSIL